MHKILELIKKHQAWFLSSCVIVFSSLGILFSYLYGLSSPDVVKYSNLMAVDYELKKQSINYIHGYLELDSKYTDAEKYNRNIEYQYKTIYRQNCYDSYLISTSDNQPIKYTSAIRNYSGGQVLANADNYQIAMVRNYWDYLTMESIGLPLFYINEESSKNNIRPNKENIDFGCYLSTTQAYDYSVKLGLLDEGESNHQTIKDAFNALILKDNDYYLELSNDNTSYTFTINNIYVDSEKFAFFLNDEQLYKTQKLQGNYYKSFSYWNKSTIFTHARDIMIKGSKLYFDIRGSYNNINLFITNVLGKQYAKEGSNIYFQSQSGLLKKYSNNVNEAYRSEKKTKLSFLLLSILSFEILFFSEIYLVSTKSKNKTVTIIKHLMPAFGFVFLWTFISLLFLFGSSYALFSYLSFNYLGNTVVLVFLAITILSGFIWKAFDDEDERII